MIEGVVKNPRPLNPAHGSIRISVSIPCVGNSILDPIQRTQA